jgi:hypothetical protein
MKKIVSLIVLLSIMLSVAAFSPEKADAAKRRKIKIKRRAKRYSRYHARRVFFKAYQEYFLTPKVKAEDEPAIIESLKSRGVSSAKLDEANNSLILQFSAAQVTALDIMKALKDLGYSVSSIN